jgi:hypothetical protein
LNGRKDLVVPVAEVLHRRVSTIIASLLVGELPVQRFAWASLAVVICEGCSQTS